MKYKIDLSNEKKMLFISIIFLFIGLIFLIVSESLFIHSKNKVNRMDALVEPYNIEEFSYMNDKGTKMYKYNYYYIVDDKKYSCSSKNATDKKLEEANVVIEYNSKNPSECIATTDKAGVNILLFIFVILGSIFVLIGLVVVLIRLKNILDKKYLASNGVLIKNIPYEMVATNDTFKGMTLYKIEAYLTLENGNMIKITSAPRFDLKDKDEDNHVDILIDKNNSNNNYVDFNIEEI